MKIFKSISLLILLNGFSIAGFAQTTNAKKKMKTGTGVTMTSVPLKEHVCTDVCHTGPHVYMHGEKGHSCTTACKKMSADTMEMKEHKCTDACEKGGKHIYTHGEKGHTCTDACEKEVNLKRKLK